MIHLAAATFGFVITHFVMSGFLRPTLVSLAGTQGFLLFYSLVSLATFAWVIVAFDRADDGIVLWNGMAAVPWTIASLLTITAMTLLIPSFVGNPALPGKKLAGLGTVVPSGAYRVTRHPMMWGIALWAIGHIVASPSMRVLILMSGLILLALLGSHFQDVRKLAQNQREVSAWQRRTSFWPQWRELAGLRTLWLLALLVWFIATWVHYHLFGIPAGLWMWIG
ncbi:MAG: NnrU family protein [Novosphingobium sp.]